MSARKQVVECSLQHSSKQVQTGRDSKAPHLLNGSHSIVVYLHNGIQLSNENERSTATHNKMDALPTQKAERKNSHGRTQGHFVGKRS